MFQRKNTFYNYINTLSIILSISDTKCKMKTTTQAINYKMIYLWEWKFVFDPISNQLLNIYRSTQTFPIYKWTTTCSFLNFSTCTVLNFHSRYCILSCEEYVYSENNKLIYKANMNLSRFHKMFHVIKIHFEIALKYILIGPMAWKYT